MGDRQPDDSQLDDAGGDLPDPQFSPATMAREGYRASDVDAFVGRLQEALREDPPALAPHDVVDQRFKVTRVGPRYDLREVDDYLDAGQERLSSRHGYESVTTRVPPGEQHRFPVGWIYGAAVVLVAIMVLFVLTQL